MYKRERNMRNKGEIASQEVIEIEAEVIRALRLRFDRDWQMRDELINLMTEAIDVGRKKARPN